MPRSNFLSGISAISPKLFLIFLFAGVCITTSIGAKNTEQMDRLSVSERPQLQFKDGVEVLENSRNPNQNEKTSNTVGYLPIGAKEKESYFKSDKFGSIDQQQDVFKSHKHSTKKHHGPRHKKKHRRHRKGGHRNHRNSKASKRVSHDATPNKYNVIASEHDPNSHSSNSDSNPSQNVYSNRTTQPCSSCRSNILLDEETVKNARIQMFIKTMADKLRLTPEEFMTKFRVNRRHSKPRYRLPDDVLEEAVNDSPEGYEEDQYYAKTLRKILPGRDIGRCLSLQTSGCYQFDIGDEAIRGGAVSGHIWLYKTPDRHDTHAQTFLVYSLRKFHNGTVHIDGLLQRHQTRVHKGWVTIPVDNIRLPNHNTEVMLAIRCSTCATKSHRTLLGAKHKYTPLLVVENIHSPREIRHRRDSEDANCDPTYRCCKASLVVNFHDLGVHEFTPSELDVSYCHGVCDMTEASSNHTMVKRKLKDRNPNLNICCAPTAFQDSRFIYQSGRGTEVVNYPSMIVTRCGCI